MMEITREHLVKARDAAIGAFESAEFYSFNISLKADLHDESSSDEIIDFIQRQTSQLKRVIKRLDDNLTGPVLRFIEEHAAGQLQEFKWRGGTYATAHEGARRALAVALNTTQLQFPYQISKQLEWPNDSLDYDTAQKICQAHMELDPQNYEVAVARVKREWALAVGAAIDDKTPPPPPPALSARDVLVLEYLTRRYPALCTNEDIENHAAPNITESLSRHTVVEAVRVLISAGYACRPNGDRKGTTATELGQKIAAQTAR